MADTSAHIVFYIPAALAEAAPHATSHHSCLEKLVARGDTRTSALRGDAQLLELFGGDASAGTARAAVSHHAQNGGSDVIQWRIIASPAHLVADHATLHFPPQHHAPLSDAESRALLAACQDHFALEGWQLDYGDAQSWYLRLSDTTAITTTSLADAVGAPLFEALPQGADARTWRRWLNEVQMLFHSHAVNEARTKRGLTPVNSLWFWGEGSLPVLTAQPFTHVFGGDLYVQGLARLSGAAWSALPEGMAALDASAVQGTVLVVLDEETDSSWDAQWFCPLSERLKSFPNVAMNFHNGYVTHLDRKQLWRFWRRKHYSIAIRMSAP
ncbi:MAG TPA: hypothetical protein VGE50_08510 [Gammaproteobacteria bacterium]